jgi:hypothetical protein
MANRLQVRVPEAFCLVVGVAHIIAHMGDFPTELTFPAHGKASFLLEIGWSATPPFSCARSSKKILLPQ